MAKKIAAGIRALHKELDKFVEENLNYRKEDVPEIIGKQRRTITNGLILEMYTDIDELMNGILSMYYLGSFYLGGAPKKNRLFRECILERLYFLDKFNHIKEILTGAKKYKSTLANLNDIRNGIAHSLFPEIRKRNKPFYKGKDVYSDEGFKALKKDVNVVKKYFTKELIRMQSR